MIAFLKRSILRIWAAAPVASALLALALVAALVFGVRASLFWADRHERIAREQPVAAWMTPGYVAHSWHLPREVVTEALALDPETRPRRETLADMAAARGVPVETLIDALETAIADHRAAPPPPGSRPAPPGDARGEQPTPGNAGSEQPAPAADREGSAE